MVVDNIVYALAATVDARDHYTYGHSKEVIKYDTKLAEVIGYSNEDIKRIREAGLLHDIGKLNLPDSILTKRDSLTDDESKMIKHHPDLGVGIIEYIVGLQGCIDTVLLHHERYDSSGYPKGLKKRKPNEEEALKELERCTGAQFDPELLRLSSVCGKNPWRSYWR